MNAPVPSHLVRLDLTDPESYPTRRVEDWRWSDVRRTLRERPPLSPEARVERAGPFAGVCPAELVFINGRTKAGTPSWAEQSPRRLYGELQLRIIAAAKSTGHQTAVRFRVEAGEDVLLLESYEGYGHGYAANTRLSFDLEPGAKLTRIVIMDDVVDALSVSQSEVRVAAGAEFTQTVLTSGAKLQRHETSIVHPGEGATVRLDGVYVLDDERHADLTTVVVHAGAGGQTRQLTKGVVRDRARGVFQGRITVERGADQTDARMGHHALILSDHAEVDAKPELEIFADDVACAHGNTIGALDQDALFYARSRGIPELEAKAMLTAAFLGQVIDGIVDARVREVAIGWLETHLKTAHPRESGDPGALLEGGQ